MPVRSLDEQADELLETYARSQRKSLRRLGIMDRARRAIVARREVPLSALTRQRKINDE